MINKPVVFISGATAGIGLETAKIFAEGGYPLVLNGRRRDRLETLYTQLSKQTEVLLAPFDVRDKKEADAWFKQHAKMLDRIGILVNNAGLARGSDLVQNGSEEDWDEMIDTNIKGLLNLCKRIIPHMAKQKKGHVINLGSVAGRWTYQGGAVYCATKFAVRALSEGFRQDLIGTGIRVTNIEPGMVETEFSEVRFRDSEKASKVYQGLTPLSARDIAETIYWVAQRPAHVNVQELVIFPTDQASIRDVHRV